MIDHLGTCTLQMAVENAPSPLRGWLETGDRRKMSNSQANEAVAYRMPRSAMRLGFWTALLLAALALAAFALGITTPPRSGPYCSGTCIVYPFTDAAQFVPRDYGWVIPGILLIPVFVIVAACIHPIVQVDRRHLSWSVFVLHPWRRQSSGSTISFSSR